MRDFTSKERQFLARLVESRSASTRLENVLGQWYFTEELGRALILQPAGGFGYLYMWPEVYDDEDRRRQETDRFIDLVMFIVYLREQGHIVVYDGEDVRARRMRLLSDGFKNPVANLSGIVLNPQGDYTSSPDSIVDAKGKVLYKGVRLDSELYRVVMENSSGLVYVSPELNEAITKQPPEKTGVSQPERSTSPSSIPRLVGLVLLLAVLGWVAFHVQSIRKTVLSWDDQYAELLNSARDVLPPDALLDSTASGLQPSLAPNGEDSASSIPQLFYGVDLSRWNDDMLGPILEADSITFVFVRASYGRSRDVLYEETWAELRAREVIRGPYHFFTMHDDPVEQSKVFVQVIGENEDLEIAPVVDFEELSFPARTRRPPAEEVQDRLLEVLEYVESETGRTPILYTNVHSGNTYLDDARFTRFPLWIADWGDRPEPHLPRAWATAGYKFWQRSSEYTVDADSTRAIDLDVFRGLKADIYR